MKYFFWKEFPFWKSPLTVFSKFRTESNALFFSGTSRGRYSFVPLKSEPLIFHRAGKYSLFQDLVELVKERSLQYDCSSMDDWDIPYSGGIHGLISYEYSHFFESDIFLKLNPEDILGIWFWSDWSIVFDHSLNKVFFTGWTEKRSIFEKEYKKRLEVFNCCTERKKDYWKGDETFISNISKKQYDQGFEECQKYLEEGKSFQINFSQGFTGKTKEDSFNIFCQAVEKNPAPMMCYWEWIENGNKKAVISCSPERLFCTNKQGDIKTQPIAGTRPRGKTQKQELLREKELHTSEKEQSEHAMLVDLHRNDFGKVCQLGTVRVSDFARIEKYETVMHLVSDIEGRIAEGKTVFDALQACFPGGSITGAPKYETMKILEQCEESSRGFYCGSAGYIGVDGQSDFNILIRTLEYCNGVLKGRAGGGIVWGADKDEEYEETFAKWAGIQKIFTNI